MPPAPFSIEPATGILSAMIVEDAELGIRRQLYFSITVPVTIPFEGKPVATEMQLDFIRMAMDGFEDMEDKTFWFPVNPAPGYIDGSLFLGQAHNPVDCTRLAFGKAVNGRLPVTLEYGIDFTYAGPEELGIAEGILQVSLAFDSESLAPILAEGARLG